MDRPRLPDGAKISRGAEVSQGHTELSNRWDEQLEHLVRYKIRLSLLLKVLYPRH